MDALPEIGKSSTTSMFINQNLYAQLLHLREGFINIMFFILTLYFLIYMIFSMWPLFVGFLGLYYHKKGLRLKARDLLDVTIKVAMFVVDLCVNIMIQTMRFVTTF